MKYSLLCLALGFSLTGFAQQKTAFQTSSPWIPQIDVRSDMAIVYGVSDRLHLTFEQRVRSWRDRGYQLAFMTGIAWGGYFDYFLGAWDGKNHLGVGQVQQNGDTIWHGHNMPYVVPVQSFIDYMKTAVVKRVIDAGIHTVFLEEPEFWARAGYSQPFKEEWQKYYGFPWRPQDASPENTYLSNKLKYHLYYHAIKEVSDYAKAYALSKGATVKVYIATHSLVNYSSWQIVSPEASLASLPGIDGYIAQVWTGTSREPTYFDGLRKERVFENAYLEYGSMVSMTAPTGRKLFFLTDPIEDRPRDWADYKKNYQATFTAEILYPGVDNYEVMPWPERIYTRPYKLANSDSAVLIPKYYSTQMQVMINVLNAMPRSVRRISGSSGIGVLMGNSLMFQRFPTHNGYDDPQFSNFYGQTLPLIKRGIPVQTVHMENLQYPATLSHIKVLVMSYSNMKPMSPSVHRYIADWVRKGGTLIYCGRDDDPYQNVMEWWDTKGNSFTAPSQHLFKLLGVEGAGRFPVGKGVVYVIRQDPKEFVLQASGDTAYVRTVRQAYGALSVKNNFYLERGPYDIVSVLDENPDTAAYVVHGPVIDLFDPMLPVLASKTVLPGEQALLYDLRRAPAGPSVLASASRIYSARVSGRSFAFVAKSPAATIDASRVWLPSRPVSVSVTDVNGAPVPDVSSSWNEVSHTLFLGFGNSPEGVQVRLRW
ncbi:hypothetical protein [Dinghuibacter silviterrae]|uniref:Beta-galactosidase-like protein n=1 Tax=Dinghuibacter silviterrae TaxID=1539049 RepID=A0A4R8DQB6_9BACT|nr:hypothetical protein [Dinghuibacter silviterrae]TDX00332.1 hypothetical protein EDB95_1353 [Dinghuibacter silviterrae]